MGELVKKADFLVAGLGAMGSAALYHLARLGADVVGIEQHRLGHALGSSHGHSRAYRNFYHDVIYVEMAEEALPLWRELEARSGEHLLTLTGLLQFGRRGSEALERKIAVMAALGRAHERLTAADVAARFPALRLPEESTACLTPLGGFLDAGRCVLTHQRQAQALGARIDEEVRVERVSLRGERPLVETSAGRYECERLIIAPGPWAAEVLEELALPLDVTRQQKFYFRPRDREAYAPARLPVYGDVETQFYGFPDYGPGLKVADDGLGEVTSADDVDRTLDEAKREELQRWLGLIMPGSGFSYVSGATCMYTVTPDRDFLIGPHPENANVLVAAGFSGHGFKFSALVGKILADLAMEGRTEQPVERFRLDRFGGAGS
ncbi:MAG: N-methyl-L-tryptophan oxidase [Caldilineaceae bacterium]|nr:N-methyl-L-tryptophan oxidase [Caldilineaceae bacterium]